MRTPTRTCLVALMLGLLCVGSVGCSGYVCHLYLRSHYELNSIVSDVSAERLESDLRTLVGFGTRHTLSETGSDTRGIGAARRWIESDFRAIASASGRTGDDAIRVEMDRHWVEPDGRRITERVEVVNPMLIIPGSMPEARGRMYYVIGHYDSRASDPNDATSEAPGADDDGSGTVLTMELARVFSKHSFDATVVFMPVAGEEQGLFGSRLHAKMAREKGWDIRGVLSNDIVGDPTAPDGTRHDDRVRLFSEGIPTGSTAEQAARIRAMGGENDSPSRELARYVAMVTESQLELAVRPWLINRPDRFLRGGDHTGFNESGYPAVRFCEVEENYYRQHQDVRTEGDRRYGDEIEFVDFDYLRGVAQLNGAALASLANAPSSPPNARIIAAELTNDTTLRWDASPEPDVAGYEVMIRDTTEQQWRVLKGVGNALEATVPYSKDNWIFGVRAYDRDGYRSPVANPRAARE